MAYSLSDQEDAIVTELMADFCPSQEDDISEI